MRFIRKYLVLGFVLLSVTATAADQIPSCPAHGKVLEINNAQVLEWKKSTPNQFLERGHIQGRVVAIYHGKQSHERFAVQIGSRAEDTIEIIYNKSFGEISDVREGMIAQACGDYITANKRAGSYPPSPDGAIVHWVHYNPGNRSKTHDHGFLALDGKLYGQTDPEDRNGNNGQGRKKYDRRNK